MVFFSYIGFDGVTVLAEEVKNPTRDIPLGIIISLGVTTLMYIATAVVLTGMVPWFTIEVDSPLPSTFDAVGPRWSTSVLGCATAISSAQLVLVGLFAQPRIFFRMARDGLLAQFFGRLNERTKSPILGTLFAGIGAGLLALVMELDDLANMISIGTLMAFSTVCAGVVTLRYRPTPPEPPPSTEEWAQAPLPMAPLAASSPLIPKRHQPNKAVWWLFAYLLVCLAMAICLRHREMIHEAILVGLGLLCLVPPWMISRLPEAPAPSPPLKFTCPLVPWLPCLGIFVNMYLLASQEPASYIRVSVWTALGMANYFFYGISHSVLNEKVQEEKRKESVHGPA